MRSPRRKRTNFSAHSPTAQSVSMNSESLETAVRNRESPDRCTLIRQPRSVQKNVHSPTSYERSSSVPESPFAGFASTLPSLESHRKSDTTPARNSPFATYTSSFSNLESPSVSTPAGVYWTRNSSLLLSPELSTLKAVRRRIGEDLDSLAPLSPQNQMSIRSAANQSTCNSANKTPRTPLRLYSFGDGANFSDMFVDPATPVALVGTYGQFTSRCSEGAGTQTPTLGQTPLLPPSGCSSISRIKSPCLNSRRRLDSRLVEVRDGSAGIIDDESSTTRRVTIEHHEDQVACSPLGELEGLLFRRRSPRKKRLEYEVYVWDEETCEEISASAVEQEKFEEEDQKHSSESSVNSKSAPNLNPTSSSASAQGPKDASKLCKCKRSKCIRQYCVCFRAGDLCKGCECNDCFNDGNHEQERLAAVEHIKTADPLAFHEKVQSKDDCGEENDAPQRPSEIVNNTSAAPALSQPLHVRGCKCKNSRCQKKYCECFEFGVACSSRCACRSCQNGKPPQQQGDIDEAATTLKKLKRSCAAVETERGNQDSRTISDARLSISSVKEVRKPALNLRTPPRQSNISRLQQPSRLRIHGQ